MSALAATAKAVGWLSPRLNPSSTLSSQNHGWHRRHPRTQLYARPVASDHGRILPLKSSSDGQLTDTLGDEQLVRRLLDFAPFVGSNWTNSYILKRRFETGYKNVGQYKAERLLKKPSQVSKEFQGYQTARNCKRFSVQVANICSRKTTYSGPRRCSRSAVLARARKPRSVGPVHVRICIPSTISDSGSDKYLRWASAERPTIKKRLFLFAVSASFCLEEKKWRGKSPDLPGQERFSRLLRGRNRKCVRLQKTVCIFRLDAFLLSYREKYTAYWRRLAWYNVTSSKARVPPTQS